MQTAGEKASKEREREGGRGVRKGGRVGKTEKGRRNEREVDIVEEKVRC